MAWAKAADVTRPWRSELRIGIAEILRDLLSPPLRILELGPGPGLLAEALLATCVVDSYILFDFSQPFLDMCRDRVGKSAAAQFVLGDFTLPDWPTLLDPPFDAVVSMQSVHEVRHKRHVAALYRQVLPLLRPDGLYIVCDHMPREDDPRSVALHSTEAEQHRAMNSAGFVGVTTQVLLHGMYVCLGLRPR